MSEHIHHYHDDKVAVKALVDDYEHRPDGCYLSLSVGPDSFHLHLSSPDVACRIADTVSAAVRAYMEQLDESVVTIPDMERRPLTVISPPS